MPGSSVGFSAYISICHCLSKQIISTVHQTHRNGYLHVVHQQSKESKGYNQNCRIFATSIREVSRRNGKGSQRETFLGQPVDQAGSEVPLLQAFDTEADQTYRYKSERN